MAIIAGAAGEPLAPPDKEPPNLPLPSPPHQRVGFAIVGLPERLTMAQQHGRAETIDFMKEDIYETLQEMTKGRRPDRCIDAVGAESHGHGSFDAVVDNIKAKMYLGTDRPHVLRQAIHCCRKAGTVSVPGVYIGLVDKMPMGAFVLKP